MVAVASVQAGSAGQQVGAPHVGGQVGITDPEPGLLAVPLELGERREGVAGDAPALLPICNAGEGVHDRVEIRTDEQPVRLRVVRHVDDHGQVAGRDDHLEAMGQLGAARAAGQERDLHVGSVTPPGSPHFGRSVSTLRAV